MTLDATEALTNACIGMVVSWSLTWAVLGFTPAQSAAVTMMFFVASFLRAWAIREAFRRWGEAIEAMIGVSDCNE